MEVASLDLKSTRSLFEEIRAWIQMIGDFDGPVVVFCADGKFVFGRIFAARSGVQKKRYYLPFSDLRGRHDPELVAGTAGVVLPLQEKRSCSTGYSLVFVAQLELTSDGRLACIHARPDTLANSQEN